MPRFKLPKEGYFVPAFYVQFTPLIGRTFFCGDARLDDLSPDTVGTVSASPIVPKDPEKYPRLTDTEKDSFEHVTIQATLAEFREICRECGEE